MKKVLKLVSLLLVSSVSIADDFQIWIPININAKFGQSDWRGFLELQPRFTNDSSTLGTAIVRPAIGYAIGHNATGWVGYGMQASEIGDTESYLIENRAWQGFSWKDIGFDKQLIWEVRNRLEERFLPGNSDPSIRWRTRFRGEIMTTYDPISIITSDEIFINLNDNENNNQLQAGLNQNRVYLGIGYRFNPELQVETGYLNQYIPGYHGKGNQVNNVWMTNLNINF